MNCHCLISLTIFVPSPSYFLKISSARIFWWLHLSVKKAMCCDIILKEEKHFMKPTIERAISIQMPTLFLLDESIVYKTLDYLDFAIFMQSFVAKKKKVFLNFNIIYKSYKCYSMTFTGEICTYQLGERSCCFSVYYIQLFHHDVTHHQYVNLSSIWKWNLCVLSYCILS